MIESWHIPRPSLGSVLGTSSSKSDDSTTNMTNISQHASSNMKRNDESEHSEISHDLNRTLNSLNNNKRKKGRTNLHHHHQQHYNNQYKYKTNGRDLMLAKIHKNGSNIKRGSSSSQGSTDSNNTSHSASSGSMLLTAANLERFIAIQNKKEQQSKIDNKYNTNITQSIANCTNGNEIILTIESDLDLMKKAKDVDTISIASSTHFTMVNGEGGPSKKIKEGLCSHGRQVTVVILSMSVLFLIGIMGMVYALEMRAREMPQS